MVTMRGGKENHERNLPAPGIEKTPSGVFQFVFNTDKYLLASRTIKQNPLVVFRWDVCHSSSARQFPATTNLFKAAFETDIGIVRLIYPDVRSDGG